MEKIDIVQLEQDLKQTLDHFKINISNMMPGNSGILESVIVEAYGSKMSLRDVASIHKLSNQDVEVKPHDRQLIKDIESAISKKNIGTVSSTSSGLIFKFPPLTLSFYEKITKAMKELVDSTKVTVRNVRRTHLDKLKELQKNNKEAYSKQEEVIQKYMDKYNKELENIFQTTSSKLKI